MSVLLSSLGGAAAQFFNNDGVILSGGFIYTYAAGSNTPQATYTTNAGTIAHNNPSILDASGRVPGGEVWLTSNLAYKVVIKDANNALIGTYDNLTGISSLTLPINASQVNFTGFNGSTGTVQDLAGNNGSDWIGFLQTGANAVAISAQNKMRQIVSVLDFNADPTGVNDSSSAFANAIATGKAIYVPTGTYKASFNLQSGQKIFGDGAVKTIIKPPSGATYAIQIDATTTAKQFCVVSDLSIQNLDAVANVTGILFKGVNVNSINDYHVLNNLLIDNCNKGIEALGRLILNRWTSVRVLNSSIGVNVSTDTSTPAFNLNEFNNCLFNYSVNEGFKSVGQSIANSFYSCNFEKNNTANAANKAGAYIEDSQNICFRGCYFEDNGYGLAANATITSNSYALRFAGTYCINPTVDCCYMAGSGAIIYVSPGAVTGGKISNTRLIANDLVGYAYYNAATQGGSKSVLVFDSTNYPYGNVYFGIGGGLTYSSAVNQNSSMDYLSGNATLDLLVNKKITINAGAPFTFTTINNRLPSCELWISNLGADATIPAAMMASGVNLTITGGTTKILVVSGYPYDGKFVVMV